MDLAIARRVERNETEANVINEKPLGARKYRGRSRDLPVSFCPEPGLSQPFGFIRPTEVYPNYCTSSLFCFCSLCLY
jgi:hypothetical protein